jgi:16S rRNA (adenine1518-N6/adenine1519-N6)-dimethyltransferase
MRERVIVRALPPLRPRRSLGQNFLCDPNIARNIVAAIAPGPNDTVVEIGPGEGALTHVLAARAGRLVIVDLDDRVIARMREMLAGTAVEVLHEDFLNVDLPALAAGKGKLRVVGNIPYNITTPILFHLLDHHTVVQDVVLMMQREVARRLSAAPGSKDYGILSVSSQFFATVELLFDVSPEVFFPRPKVTSTAVQLIMRTTPLAVVHDEAFFRSMVRAVFGKRRKTLRNSLRYFLGAEPPSGLDDVLGGGRKSSIEELPG